MSSSSFSPEFLNKLPKEKMWNAIYIYEWEEFWYKLPYLQGAMAAQTSFNARDDDAIIASPTKAGSTWLKALIPCDMDEKSRTISDVGDEIHRDQEDILMENHPNDLMLSLELKIFNPNKSQGNFSEMSSLRIFRTHIPYHHCLNG